MTKNHSIKYTKRLCLKINKNVAHMVTYREKTKVQTHRIEIVLMNLIKYTLNTHSVRIKVIGYGY